MSNHEQPTPSHPKSDVRNTTGKNKQIPQDSVRTTSAVDLEEFCEKHYEKLLPIMADKYEYEKRKKEKLEEVKARLDFGDARKKSTRAQESAYSESRTVSPRRRRRSRSPRHNPSVFTRLRRERSRSPRHEYKNKEKRESTVFKRLGSRGRSTSAYSDSRQESSRYMENYSESEDSEGGIGSLNYEGKSPMLKMMISPNLGQEAASNQERKKVPQAWRHPEGNHRQNFKKGGGFRSQHKTEKRPDRFTLLTKTLKEILALEKGKFKTPPPMTTPVEKRNANKFCEFHGEVGHNTDECNHLRKQIEDMLKAGKLSHIIRELKQNSGKEQPKKKGETSGKEKPQAILMIQSRQKAVRQKITQSFSPDLEISFPSLGNDEGAEGPLIIEAEVGGHQVHRMCIDGGSVICRRMTNIHITWMDFMVVRSTSPFNGIIGRPGLRKIKAVPSTTHGMIKFPVMGGTLTLKSSKIIPVECAMISGPEDQSPPVNKVKEERIKVAINPSHQKQQQIAEHKLNVRKGCQPVRQKKRGQAAERNVAINDEVSKLVKARIMREVHYHDWLSNQVMVKKSDNSWRICVDFKDINKACPKDGYPRRKKTGRSNLCVDSLSNASWTHTRVITNTKCREDEEKTAFITNQGTYSKVTYAHRSRRTRGNHCLPGAFQEALERRTNNRKGS
ncbi:hypothetical protein Tco_0671906 [Tanacetum coccineum]